ncbi:MAG: NAD-dependent succinate-semialdehyde dehydrogenase, partial [Alphaproteobacteria bacterium]|nr:NAD-dependent succinate-semialdehyde dehydrogenase [Alphaproteobacteria bacterium]
GFAIWRATAPAKRAAIVRAAGAIIRSRRDDLARVMAMELGKPVREGRLEADRAAEHCDWHAAEALRAYGRVVPGASGVRQTVLRVPVGPVAGFTPWNGPAASPARKISAALGAGCAIVLKPAEETPGTAVLLVSCFAEAGVPPGVINLLFGVPAEISGRLIASPAIRMVAFTGSVPVGRLLAQQAGAHLKPAVMELGGHAPVIVCGDADPAAAAAATARSKFRNAGQICIAPTRFYVHAQVYDRFVDEFAAVARGIKVGPGLDESTEMGPLANARRLAAMERLVADAVERGARRVAGGSRMGNRGFFFAPTVLAEVDDDCLAMREEPFGPLALITRFVDLDDAIARANATPYGLAAYAFTDSARAAARLGEMVDCGVVSINHLGGAAPEIPFGGMKDSGFGREGGAECFDGYMTTRLVSQLN